MIVARNIVKKYGDSEQGIVLKGISLEIPKKKIVAIYGPSGSGKTTLLNILSTLDTEYEGELIFENQNMKEISQKKKTNLRKNDVGFIFQRYELFPMLTARENILISANLVGAKALNIDDIAENLGIADKLKNYPGELSGGQQQRIAIARALIKNPSYIFCDEPTGALDTKSSQEVIKLIKSLNKKFETTFIIVTHDPNVAQMSDMIIRIDSGEIVNIDYKEGAL
ncbi:MAG: ABC transporter ATP-binding protein [Culicoidibacterales bacterium]